MSAICIKGSLCNGCGLCYRKSRVVGECSVCHRPIREGEYSLLTEMGPVCENEDCLFEFALSVCNNELIEFAGQHITDFLSENAEAMFYAAVNNKPPNINFLNFAGGDKGAFCEFLFKKRGYSLLPSV